MRTREYYEAKRKVIWALVKSSIMMVLAVIFLIVLFIPSVPTDTKIMSYIGSLLFILISYFEIRYGNRILIYIYKLIKEED